MLKIRIRSKSLSALALGAGAMLAMMIDVNSQLAGHTSGFHASWFAHGIGAATALLLMTLLQGVHAVPEEMTNDTVPSSRLFYLGGVPGAFTVILASIAVQSDVGLSGTLALGLVGQLVFSLMAEQFGWLHLPRKNIDFNDLLPIALITAGTTLIIYSRYQ